MKCTGFKKHSSGCLMGFATIETMLGPHTIQLKSCKMFKKDDQTWLNLPEHEYQDAAGEKAYSCDFRFTELEDKKQFCELAKEAVLKWISSNQDGQAPEASPFDGQEYPF